MLLRPGIREQENCCEFSVSPFPGMWQEVAPMCTMVNMWSGDSLLESVFFYHVDSGDHTPVTRIGGKHL